MNEGRHTVTIAKNTINKLGDNSAVVLDCDAADSEFVQVLIWLTEKTIKSGMVRGSLKLCGFDPDTESLSVLIENPMRLAGVEIPVKVEEYKGKMRAKIDLNSPPPPNVVLDLDAAMKQAHDDADEIPF